jgi:signal transduction histidine kinase
VRCHIGRTPRCRRPNVGVAGSVAGLKSIDPSTFGYASGDAGAPTLNGMAEVSVRLGRVDHPGFVPGGLFPPEDPSSRGPAKRSARDWTVDVSAFLLAVLLGLQFLDSSLGASSEDVSAAAVTVDVVLGGIGCLLLWLRRRWPVGVAIAMMPIAALSAFSTVAVLLAVFTVAVHRRTSIALGIAAGNLACSLVFPLWRPLRAPLWTVLLFSVIVVAALVAWGMFVRARRQLVWSLRERAERAEAEQRMLADQARAAERTRIAREMHDVLAHRISLIALHAGALEVQPELAPDEVRSTAKLLRSTARQALEELRSVIGVLRDDEAPTAPTVPQPTLADIPRMVADVTRAGAKVDFEMQVSDEAQPPSGLGRDAFRIVQEALTNVNKHARGTATVVRITGGPSKGLTIAIRNRMPVANGVGAVGLPGSGMGLVGLRERVALAGGTLVSGPNAGEFVVEARLPWPA